MNGRRRPLVIAGIVSALVVLVVAGALVVKANSTPAYRNPVVDHDAPDPSVIEGGDGEFKWSMQQ